MKLLVFDTFGTVVDWRSVVIEEGTQLSKAKGFTVDWPTFADEWRAAYGPSITACARASCPWTKLDVLHRMSLDALLGKHGITALSDSREGAVQSRVASRASLARLGRGPHRLKTRFTIAPLSNGNISLLTDMAKHGGLPWNCILGAELVRTTSRIRNYLSPVEFFDFHASGGDDGRRPPGRPAGPETSRPAHRVRPSALRGRFGRPESADARRRQFRHHSLDMRELATALGV